MFCRNCGNEINNNTRFCPKCGVDITQGNNSISQHSNNEAKWESKTIQANTSEENSIIEIHEAFGWELYSSQTIDKQDSHIENNFGVLTSVTEYEKYVKITFRRNKNMASYNQLCELEEKYQEADCIFEPKTASNWMIILGIILGVFGLLLRILGLTIIGIVLLVVHFVQKSKKDSAYKEYLKEKEEADEIKYNCIEEAKRLR